MDHYVVINGTLTPASSATIGINDLALNRGYGVFDFFRLSKGVPLFLEAHIDRLFRSAAAMHLPTSTYSKTSLAKDVAILATANKLQNAGIKILITGGPSADGYQIGEPTIIISSHSLPILQPQHDAPGLSLITHPFQRELPEVKTINYLQGIWLLPQIAAAGADDVLYYADGNIRECPRSNVFIVTRQQQLITPKDHVLHGITRSRVLACSSQHFDSSASDITLQMLTEASEVFITSTTKGIAPVTRIDGIPVNDGKPGAVTQQLQQLLQQDEQQYIATHKW
jgi:branched-chain amino acid aminotransferase